MFKQILELLRKKDLLSQAIDRSAEMLRQDFTMFRAAIHSLRRRDDSRIELDVYAADREINAYEREVRRKVITHLTVSGGADVTAALVLVSIVIDIERIGDFTKNIVDLALRHPGALHCGEFETDVTRIEEAILANFDRAQRAFTESDREAGSDAMSEHWWISRRADDIVHALVDRDHPGTACRDAVSIALYVRYLKRISAHLMNIASSVVNPFERIGFRQDGSDDDRLTHGGAPTAE